MPTPEELRDQYQRKLEELNQRQYDNKVEDSLFDWLPEGDNPRRFFSNPTDGSLYLEGGQHSNLHLLGVKPEIAKRCFCPTMFEVSLPCPICEDLEAYRNSKNPADKEVYKKCKASSRYFAWVAVLENPQQQEANSVKVLGFGEMILKQLLQYYCDDEVRNFTDFEIGRVMVINRTGLGFSDTEYLVKPRMQASQFTLNCDLTDIRDSAIPRSYDDLRLMLQNIKPKGVDTPAPAAPAQPRQPSRQPAPAAKAAPQRQSPGAPARTPAPAPPPAKTATPTAAPRRPAAAPPAAQPPRAAAPPPARRQAAPLPPPAAEPEPQAAEGGVPEGAPECFGISFVPRSEECRACGFKAMCLDLYVHQNQ